MASSSPSKDRTNVFSQKQFLRGVAIEPEGGEARDAVLGMTRGWRLLFVVYHERGDVFRIISARPATSPTP